MSIVAATDLVRSYEVYRGLFRKPGRLRAVGMSGPVHGGLQMAAGGHSVEAPAEPIPAQRSAADSPAPADTAGSGAGGSP